MKLARIAVFIAFISCWAAASVWAQNAPIGPGGGPGSGGGGGGSSPCSAFGTAAGTCAQGNDARLGAGAVTGAIKSNGSNSFSQAGYSDLASGAPTATSSILGLVKPDGTTIANSAGAISVIYGTAANTAAQGNDSRITGALQTSGLGTGVAAALGNTAGGAGGFALQSSLASYCALAGGAACALTGSESITESIGASSTDGLLLTNTTAAANNAQQWSPRTHWTGQAWDTTNSASHTIDWILENQPIQGTGTAYTGRLALSVAIPSVSSGAYNVQAYFDAKTSVFNNNGPIQATGSGSFANVGSYVLSQITAKPNFILNSAGTNNGLISNVDAHTWSLGYGSSLTTLGTSVLSWTDNGSVTIAPNNGQANVTGALTSSTRATLGSATLAAGQAGDLGQIKEADAAAAPGAGFAVLKWVAGTNAGSCKLIGYAGTSATPVTVVDNVGASC